MIASDCNIPLSHVEPETDDDVFISALYDKTQTSDHHHHYIMIGDNYFV